MGGGDLKLGAMLGAFLGWKALLFALFVAIVLGGAIGAVLLRHRSAWPQGSHPVWPIPCRGWGDGSLLGRAGVQLVDGRVRRMNARGFALAELMVVLAIAGALAMLVAPTLSSYARTAALQAAARELATTINLGRQIAISRNIDGVRRGRVADERPPQDRGMRRLDLDRARDRRLRHDQDFRHERAPDQRDGERRLHESGSRDAGRHLHADESDEQRDTDRGRRRDGPCQRAVRHTMRNDRGFSLGRSSGRDLRARHRPGGRSSPGSSTPPAASRSARARRPPRSSPSSGSNGSRRWR